ncbi:cytochrome P450 4C1-like isoform X2 [Anoplolepis gracilipes]|uniref:cytochrome P450 4C1-like isoform X2 n=1 Tax=Anoplolepis gracilipes TaxID=354296 RepID=UPI003BA2A287
MAFLSIQFAVLIILVCIAISYFILNYRQQSSVKTINNIPGPKTFPLIGSAYYFLQYKSDDFLDMAFKLAEDYSSPFKFEIGTKLFIVIYEPDQIKTILQSSVDKSMIYNMFEPILGKGLVTAPLSIWSKHRKIIMRSFNKSTLQKYFDIFVKQSLILTNELEKIGLNGNNVSLLKHISKYTVRAACGTMTDIKIESLSNQINQFIEATTSSKKIVKLRMRNIFLHPNFIFNLTSLGRGQRQNQNFFHSFTNKVVQEQIYASSEQNIKNNENRTLLDILIEAFQKDKSSKEKIHDNLITMILAGYDTTSVTINLAIFMLANFPEIQEKVYKELWEIYRTETPESVLIKYEDLSHMNYLECVIKETMRLFPTIPVVSRCLTEDVKIEEYILPKGTNILMPIIIAHRNEKYWPNPLIFDPDRFLYLKKRKIPYSSYYMPFSMGSRNCIGMNYAMILMKVVLATLIQTFVFKVDQIIPIHKIKLNTDLALSSVLPLKVKIEKRSILKGQHMFLKDD